MIMKPSVISGNRFSSFCFPARRQTPAKRLPSLRISYSQREAQHSAAKRSPCCSHHRPNVYQWRGFLPPLVTRYRLRAIDDEKESVTTEEKEKDSPPAEETPITPNYAVWILSLMSVIAVFYIVVFYAGAGFFYFLSKKVGFKKKDFVPYSERMEKERQEMLKKLEEAPPLASPLEETD